MDERIKEILSVNCYFPHQGPSHSELFLKIVDREPIKEELEEISDFIKNNIPLSGCKKFFNRDSEGKHDCIKGCVIMDSYQFPPEFLASQQTGSLFEFLNKK